MRVTLIHNPEAGDETRPTRGQLEALIKEAGHKVRYQSVKDSGWSKVLKKQADLIAVAGGDGTIGKVARHMIGGKVPLTALPMGGHERRELPLHAPPPILDPDDH